MINGSSSPDFGNTTPLIHHNKNYNFLDEKNSDNDGKSYSFNNRWNLTSLITTGKLKNNRLHIHGNN